MPRRCLRRPPPLWRRLRPGRSRKRQCRLRGRVEAAVDCRGGGFRRSPRTPSRCRRWTRSQSRTTACAQRGAPLHPAARKKAERTPCQRCGAVAIRNHRREITPSGPHTRQRDARRSAAHDHAPCGDRAARGTRRGGLRSPGERRGYSGAPGGRRRGTPPWRGARCARRRGRRAGRRRGGPGTSRRDGRRPRGGRSGRPLRARGRRPPEWRRG